MEVLDKDKSGDIDESLSFFSGKFLIFKAGFKGFYKMHFLREYHFDLLWNPRGF